jgi:hypothetical protein
MKENNAPDYISVYNDIARTRFLLTSESLVILYSF